MTHSDACTMLVAQYEGFKQLAYRDGNGIWTLGYGHTGGVLEGDSCTSEQAQQWLSDDLGTAAGAINRFVTIPLTQNEFDALASLCYNIGQGNFEKSTCLRMLNQGFKTTAINSLAYFENDEWHGWVFIAGEVSSGLVRRRQAEQALFLTLET